MDGSKKLYLTKNQRQILLVTPKTANIENPNKLKGVVVRTSNLLDQALTCLDSPFLPPIVVEMMWPVTGSLPSMTEAGISCNRNNLTNKAHKKIVS